MTIGAPIIDKVQVARRFDRHAATYDAHAKVQIAMAARVIEHLDELGAQPCSILELGCGTGELTSLLLRHFPRSAVTAIDFSPKMIEATRVRVVELDRLELVFGDIEEQRYAQSFDLIVSNATIQWLATPQTTMAALVGLLRPGGFMVHHTFGPRTFQELAAAFARVESETGSARVQRGIGLHSTTAWREMLNGAGAQSVGVRSREVIAEYPSCKAFLDELRGTGASYTRGAGHRPTVLSRVIDYYDQQFATTLGVRATYEVIELNGGR